MAKRQVTAMVGSLALLGMGCAPAPATLGQGHRLATLQEGFFMSEQKVVQPTSGSASVEGASLSWALADGTLNYTITVEVLNACYKAGPVTVEETNGLITLNAAVTYEKAMCAQVLQKITFEGGHDVSSEGFTVQANISDKRIGRVTQIE